MKILAIANQKGGVGKTTTAVHLAHLAQERGQRVLVVDLDPQANTSHCFTEAGGASLVGSDLFADALTGKQPEAAGAGLGLIRADRGLHDVEALPLEAAHNPAKALRALAKDYDLCLIDTPPTLGRRLLAALIAADYVLTPFSLEKFSLDGIGALIETIQMVRLQDNPRLQYLGILPNRVNARSKQQKAALQELQEQLGAYMLPHVLYDRVAISDSLALGRPVWKSTKGESHKKAAQEMRAACEDILNKVTK